MINELSRGKNETSIKTQTLARDVQDGQVSILVNCILYFVSHAYVLKEAGLYRLIVIRDNRLLTDISYKTAKGARIAFTKLYKPWKGIKANWGPFYNPEMNWYQQMSEIVKDNHTLNH